MSQAAHALVIPKGEATNAQKAFIYKVLVAAAHAKMQVAIVNEDEDVKSKEYPVPFFRAGDLVFFDDSVALKY